MRSIRTPNLRTEHVNSIEHRRTLLAIWYGAYSVTILRPDTMIDQIVTT